MRQSETGGDLRIFLASCAAGRFTAPPRLTPLLAGSSSKWWRLSFQCSHCPHGLCEPLWLRFWPAFPWCSHWRGRSNWARAVFGKLLTVPSDPTGPPAFVLSRRNVVALVLIGAAVSVLCGYFLLSRSLGSALDKSVAVLPFDNFSEDKENEHFADGVHDDVLTSLAKIEDLKVISRTSVMQYRE